MHEQVVHGLDVFGEESHCTLLFLGTRRRGAALSPIRAIMFDCYPCANRLTDGMFLKPSKNASGNMGIMQRKEPSEIPPVATHNR
jgi:hypothetical protein